MALVDPPGGLARSSIMRATSALLAASLCLGVLGPAARAADHRDGPGLLARFEGDLTDLYAFPAADGSKVVLALAWQPGATRFSDAVLWAFHVQGRQRLTDTGGAETTIICGADVGQRISCWAGPEYVSGDASGKAGLQSRSGRL